MLQMQESYERKTTFRVGDRVRTLTNEQVKEPGRLKFERGDAPDLWTNTKCQLCGKTGTVDDVYRSAKYGCTIYTVRFDGATAVSSAVFVAEDLVPIHEYSYAFDWTDETCTAMLKDGDRVIATATAKLFSQDPLGYANAASMAAKFLYFDLKEKNDDLTRLEGTAQDGGPVSARNIPGTYKVTAIIYRYKNGIRVSAELQDTAAPQCLVIAKMEDIQ